MTDISLIDPTDAAQNASVESREDDVIAAAAAEDDLPVYDAPMLDRIRTSD